jgi:hypothetical protein
MKGKVHEKAPIFKEADPFVYKCNGFNDYRFGSFLQDQNSLYSVI